MSPIVSKNFIITPASSAEGFINIRLNIAKAFGGTLLEGWKLSDEILAFCAPALEK